jgi:predicted ATPase/class 3 adenylate cyclase
MILKPSMRPDLPTGTVTFLFTDVEGSTKLLEELGEEAYDEALAEHRRIVRGSCTAHGGAEVDTQGDAFFFAFASAPEAVAAASMLTEELVPGPIRVRVGLHTGVPRLSSEGYVGREVHFAARVAATGHGGQIVLSRATAALLDGLELIDLGEHRLKDIPEPVAIYQLGRESFPPLKTISNTNLPRPASSFVGRERELREVLGPIEYGARLLTLTGPGGSGKTRLALEAAATLVPAYKAGVFWVGLASLRDPSLVTEQIAQTLGAKEGLVEHIGEREMLLLLDNLEQVIEAAPELTSLLQTCPNLTLLVTSRELLRVQGEVEYAVPPLASPEAVSLFCERSRLEPTEEIAELCARLDNLPLAVELAAARTKALTPAQILDRLSQRLDLLKGGRDADPRQQTLRATIAWSYDLLQEEEQRLFRALSVFSGGCTLEAAEEVAEADLDTLQSLVEKSLLRFSDGRYWMLETIREHATERLNRSPDAEALRRRHAEYYLVIADTANLSLEALDRGPQRHELVIPEQHNLRAAIDWGAEFDPELALRLMHALESFWITRDPAEGERRYRLLLDRAIDVDPLLLARAYRDYGSTCHSQARLEEADRAYQQAHRLFRKVGDTRGEAEIVMRLGMVACRVGELERGRKLLEESLDRFRELRYPIGELQVLSTLGHWEFESGRPESGWELTGQSLQLAREAGWTWWETNVLGELAERSLEAGRIDDGERLSRELLGLAHEIGDRIGTIYGLGLLAWAAAESGNTRRSWSLWAAIEAEEARAPVRGEWAARDREKYARHLPAGSWPDAPLPLDAAVEYALASSTSTSPSRPSPP